MDSVAPWSLTPQTSCRVNSDSAAERLAEVSPEVLVFLAAAAVAFLTSGSWAPRPAWPAPTTWGRRRTCWCSRPRSDPEAQTSTDENCEKLNIFIVVKHQIWCWKVLEEAGRECKRHMKQVFRLSLLLPLYHLIMKLSAQVCETTWKLMIARWRVNVGVLIISINSLLLRVMSHAGQLRDCSVPSSHTEPC